MYEQPNRTPLIGDQVYVDMQKSSAYGNKADWRKAKVVGISHDNNDVLCELEGVPQSETEMKSFAVLKVMFTTDFNNISPPVTP
jgi:hypothetical protein